jgi:hypothetical protein
MSTLVFRGDYPWNVPLEPIAKKVAQYNEGK